VVVQRRVTSEDEFSSLDGVANDCHDMQHASA
jgi:hypothetical protein